MTNLELITTSHPPQDAANDANVEILRRTRENALQIVRKTGMSSQSVWAWTVDMLRTITGTETNVDVAQYASLVTAKAGLIMEGQSHTNSERSKNLSAGYIKQVRPTEQAHQKAA